MKIVCDTNILISALVFPAGIPDQVLQLARLKQIELYLSPDILTEFKKVLRLKFKYSEDETLDFTDHLLNFCLLAYPTDRLQLIKRKDSDNRILECAVAAKADYLITGDKKDILPLKKIGKTKIVTAREFIEIWTKI